MDSGILCVCASRPPAIGVDRYGCVAAGVGSKSRGGGGGAGGGGDVVLSFFV